MKIWMLIDSGSHRSKSLRSCSQHSFRIRRSPPFNILRMAVTWFDGNIVDKFELAFEFVVSESSWKRTTLEGTLMNWAILVCIQNYEKVVHFNLIHKSQDFFIN
jgi:hypothetical protein